MIKIDTLIVRTIDETEHFFQKAEYKIEPSGVLVVTHDAGPDGVRTVTTLSPAYWQRFDRPHVPGRVTVL